MKTHPHALFVYGTLKPGHGNNPLIQRHGGADMGQATTVGKLLLNDGFPFVWLMTNPPCRFMPYLGRVVGHLYRVSDEGLEACDRLEGHPQHYRRFRCPVIYGPENTYEAPYLYFAPGQPDLCNLQKPVGGLLEWGRDRPNMARNFQRRQTP